MNRNYPFTGDDLIAIGQIVNQVTQMIAPLDPDSGDSRNENIHSVRVKLTYEGSVVGEISDYEGWLGFYPAKTTGGYKEDN